MAQGQGLTVTDLQDMRGKLVNYFRHSAGDAAEDIVASILADGAIRIDHGETILATWVWRGCRWAAIDYSRALGNRHELPGQLPETIPAPASLDVPAEGFEESTEVALGKLTDRQIVAVTLKADGYTREEIGERLGCSPGAVGHILFRARIMVKTEPSAPPKPVPVTLSPRELEVIAALADGLDHTGIAHRLGCSISTVRTYLTSAYAKLDAANAAGAVAVALRRRLIK